MEFERWKRSSCRMESRTAVQSCPSRGKGSGAAKKLERGRGKMERFSNTKFCPFLPAGMCKRGANCNFAHQISDLRGAPRLWKTRLCQHYKDTGICEAGEECRFAHGVEELRKVVLNEPGMMGDLEVEHILLSQRPESFESSATIEHSIKAMNSTSESMVKHFKEDSRSYWNPNWVHHNSVLHRKFNNRHSLNNVQSRRGLHGAMSNGNAHSSFSFKRENALRDEGPMRVDLPEHFRISLLQNGEDIQNIASKMGMSGLPPIAPHFYESNDGQDNNLGRKPLREQKHPSREYPEMSETLNDSIRGSFSRLGRISRRSARPGANRRGRRKADNTTGQLSNGQFPNPCYGLEDDHNDLPNRMGCMMQEDYRMVSMSGRAMTRTGYPISMDRDYVSLQDQMNRGEPDRRYVNRGQMARGPMGRMYQSQLGGASEKQNAEFVSHSQMFGREEAMAFPNSIRKEELYRGNRMSARAEYESRCEVGSSYPQDRRYVMVKDTTREYILAPWKNNQADKQSPIFSAPDCHRLSHMDQNMFEKEDHARLKRQQFEEVMAFEQNVETTVLKGIENDANQILAFEKDDDFLSKSQFPKAGDMLGSRGHSSQTTICTDNSEEARLGFKMGAAHFWEEGGFFAEEWKNDPIGPDNRQFELEEENKSWGNHMRGGNHSARNHIVGNSPSGNGMNVIGHTDDNSATRRSDGVIIAPPTGDTTSSKSGMLSETDVFHASNVVGENIALAEKRNTLDENITLAGNLSLQNSPEEEDRLVNYLESYVDCERNNSSTKSLDVEKKNVHRDEPTYVDRDKQQHLKTLGEYFLANENQSSTQTISHESQRRRVKKHWNNECLLSSETTSSLLEDPRLGGLLYDGEILNSLKEEGNSCIYRNTDSLLVPGGRDIHLVPSHDGQEYMPKALGVCTPSKPVYQIIGDTIPQRPPGLKKKISISSSFSTNPDLTYNNMSTEGIVSKYISSDHISAYHQHGLQTKLPLKHLSDEKTSCVIDKNTLNTTICNKIDQNFLNPFNNWLPNSNPCTSTCPSGSGSPVLSAMRREDPSDDHARLMNFLKLPKSRSNSLVQTSFAELPDTENNIPNMDISG